MAKCKYKSELRPDYKCPEDALADSEEGFCIFHERRKNKDIQEFNAGIKAKMENKDYDFRGYYFPSDIDFSNQKFERDAQFIGAEFQRSARFSGAEFQGSAWFDRAEFQAGAFFDGAEFQGLAGFLRVKFHADALFEEAKFQDEALFEGAELRRGASFKGTKFEGRASFVGALFHDVASFDGAEFQDWTFFDVVQFSRAARLATAKFARPVSFRDAYFAFAVDADIAYRYAKDTWRSEGDYDEAGHYYLLRARARRRQRNPIARGLEFIFLDLTCGYGEQPWKVVLTALALVFGCAFLYYFFFPITSADIQITGVGWGYFKDCLYFSSVTFTTLGYGDLRPMIEVGTRAVASIEAFTGAFVMALFALCLGRKWIR